MATSINQLRCDTALSWAKSRLEAFANIASMSFDRSVIGPPRAYALLNTGGGVYKTHEWRIALVGDVGSLDFMSKMDAEVDRILNVLLLQRDQLLAIGEKDLELTWRHPDRFRVAIERDFTRPGTVYVLAFRIRVAITTATQREEDRAAPPAEEVETVPPPPRARLYSDEELTLMRVQAHCDGMEFARLEYLRIPLIGLYAYENWYPLRLWRIWVNRIKHPSDYRTWPWWRWWPYSR